MLTNQGQGFFFFFFRTVALTRVQRLLSQHGAEVLLRSHVAAVAGSLHVSAAE